MKISVKQGWSFPANKSNIIRHISVTKSFILLKISQFFCILAFFFLLTHSALILSQAREGLSSWAFTVVPVLLPFIILSKFWIYYNMPQLFYEIAKKILPRHHSAALSITLLLLGLSTGFPVGAIFVRHFYETNLLSKQETEKLLPLCSFVSPMFLMGYVRPMIEAREMSWSFFVLALYLPIIVLFLREYLEGNIRPGQQNKNAFRQTFSLGKPDTAFATFPSTHKSSIREIWLSSLEVIFTIGIYMMLFSILFGLALDQPFFEHISMQVLLCNLEVTTGIEWLSHLSTTSLADPLFGMVLASTIAGGGICTMAQVYSVVSDTSLSLKSYIILKGKCAICSSLLYLMLYKTFL